jgi:UDP-N-acetylmuramate-alanine ligase
MRPSVRDLHLTTLDAVPAIVANLAKPGDVVLMLGAGSISTASDRVLAALAMERVQ